MGNDTKVVKKAAAALRWPGRSTLTSYSIANSWFELINGREDAKSVVVVITDGKPLSVLKTGVASEEIKKLARLVWIPVGQGVKSAVENMKGWASQPWQDNVLEIETLATLDTPGTINKMASQFCAQLGSEAP